VYFRRYPTAGASLSGIGNRADGGILPVAGGLSWERLEGKRACRIKYAQEGGGYRSPEDQWPKMQDGIIAATQARRYFNDRIQQALFVCRLWKHDG
jgi:hypothetical protein